MQSSYFKKKLMISDSLKIFVLDYLVIIFKREEVLFEVEKSFSKFWPTLKVWKVTKIRNDC